MEAEYAGQAVGDGDGRAAAPAATQSAITLEQVRARFLEADQVLRQAADSVESVRAAAAQLGAARDGLQAAGVEVGRMVESVDQAREQLAAAVTSLDQGVEVLSKSDPARIIERINEVAQKQLQRDVQIMDAAKASGSTTVSRLDETDKAIAELKEQGAQQAKAIAELRAALEAQTERSGHAVRQVLVAVIASAILVLVVLAIGIGYLATRPTS